MTDLPLKKPKSLSEGEESLALQIRALKLPAPIREYAFHPTRKYKFDFAWPAIQVAVEVEGLTREGGRHQRFAGMSADLAKYLDAAELGWLVLRVSSAQVKCGRAVEVISAVLKSRMEAK